nr:HAMP domain-containing histidine kinase [Eubacterium sp.]
MKKYNQMLAIVLVIMAMIFVGTNLYLSTMKEPKGREHRVEIERAAMEVKENGLTAVNLEKYPTIVRIVAGKVADDKSFYEGEEEDYVIRNIDGVDYRFDYEASSQEYQSQMRQMVNIVLGIVTLLVLAMFGFIKVRVLRPFHQLSELPYELSKGNMTMPLKENKERFFGRFLWGMDLLRERLEAQKVSEYELQKEKKTLILSISHDIKTPLSAIKLYAKALMKNLYQDSEKQVEIAGHINDKADEIENFVSQIIKASNEDFLSLEVENGEFYLAEILEKITTYYTEKLELLQIDFEVESVGNCLLKGDSDRAVEVLQNLFENALKYGDGRKISLSFSEEENYRMITVSNTGCTLSDSEVPHIFDSFWRGSNVGSHGGSGLGLYICRQLMQKMGGEIYAKCTDGKMEVTVLFSRA